MPKSVWTQTCKSLWASISVNTPTTNKKSRRPWLRYRMRPNNCLRAWVQTMAYWSGANLQALEQKGVDAYVATGKDEKLHKIPVEASERKLVKADFQYHEADNTFTCPAGQVLVMISESKRASGYIRAVLRSVLTARSAAVVANRKKVMHAPSIRMIKNHCDKKWTAKW